MEHFCLYSLMSMVLAVKSQHIVIASLNGEALFPCGESEVNAKSCLRVRWVKYASDVKRIILSKPKAVDIPDDDRAAWVPDGNRNLLLSLTKLQKSDEGLYSCEIWREWNRIHVQNMSLVLKDCTSRTVKVVPGTPFNLSCPMDSAMATQPGHTDISWVMLKAAKPSPITSKIAKVNGALLSFGSVDGKDKNWYRCNYTLGRVSYCYDINLRVKDSDLLATTAMETRDQLEEVQHSSKVLAPALTVIVASVAAALTVIVASVAAAAAGFIMYRRRSRRCNHTAAPPAQSCPAKLHSCSRAAMQDNHVSFHRLPTDATDVYENYDNQEYAEYKHSSLYHINSAQH